MIDTSFLTTLLIIFLGAMIGSYFRGSSRDRCLKDFDRYHVTLEKKDGKIIWGEMRLEPTGMELQYRTDVEDIAHVETSYLYYSSEYKDLQGLYRYVDELSPHDRQRRERALKNSFHPTLGRIVARRLRNFLIRATDSLGEAMPLITGQAKKPAGRHISAAEEVYLQKLGKNIIGYVGTGFDPLLEEYVGAKIVAEIVEGGKSYEHVGILKEYSAEFLEILDVFYPQTRSINLSSAAAREALEKDVHITFDSGSFLLRNLSPYPLLLHRIRRGDRQGEINAVIGPGDELRLQDVELDEVRTHDKGELSIFFEGMLSDEEEREARGSVENKRAAELMAVLEGFSWETTAQEHVQFDFRVIRLLDMIVPRNHALIRHKAERYDPNQILGRITRSDRLIHEELNQEVRYRTAITKDPADVTSIVALSGLLMRRGELEEAQQWLEMALRYRDKLVDDGRFVEMELRLVKQKLSARQKAKA